ncbi:unnamed protein product [Sphagnum troendelagicum]|jgi:hypothetical protein
MQIRKLKSLVVLNPLITYNKLKVPLTNSSNRILANLAEILCVSWYLVQSSTLSQPVKTELAQLTDPKDELLRRLWGIILQQRLKNSSHDLETNFKSKLNEQVELLRQVYSAECLRRLETQREKFMTKQEEMYLQMNCLQEGKDKLVELILYLEQQHAAKSLQGG